jgi:hypothetical protein
MSFVFRPIGILLGLVAGMGARKIFDALWGLISDEEAPSPQHREIEWLKLIPALLVEGAISRLVRGLVDHHSRRTFATLTGTWPGQEAPEPE